MPATPRFPSIVLSSLFNFCLAIAPYPALGALIQLAADGTAIADSDITIDRKFVGRVGDVVELKDGSHAVVLGGSMNGPSAWFTLKITGENVSVTGLGGPPWGFGSCGDGKPLRAVTWPAPAIIPPSPKAGFTRINIASPEFGAPTRKGQECISGAGSGCNPKSIKLKATTSPPGATILIDGEEQDFLTNTKLISVPYCPNDKKALFVFRKTGYVNCSRDVALPPAAPPDVVSCELKPASARR